MSATECPPPVSSCESSLSVMWFGLVSVMWYGLVSVDGLISVEVVWPC